MTEKSQAVESRQEARSSGYGSQSQACSRHFCSVIYANRSPIRVGTGLHAMSLQKKTSTSREPAPNGPDSGSSESLNSRAHTFHRSGTR